MSNPKEIHPYLDRILTQGIATDEDINPVLHSCAFKLNLEKRNEYITVECNFSNAEVYYNNIPVAKVKWFHTGCTFEVYKYCYALVEMVAGVLETIQELKEIH
jgi:hypothetical protein